MNAIKSARRFMEANPSSDSARILAQLVLALESDADFELASLYELDYDRFHLAIEILREWRLDRYYTRKVRLLDASVHLSEIQQQQQQQQQKAA